MSFEIMMTEWNNHKKEPPRPSFCQVSTKATLIAEVGVLKGWNAKVMLKARPTAHFMLIEDYNPSHPTLKILADEFTRSQRDAFIFRVGVELADFKDRFTFIFEDSLAAVKRFQDESFDYVYLDNDRDAEQISEQMRQWWPKIKKEGGVLAGSGIIHASIKTALDNVFRGRYDAETPDWWKVKK